MFRLIPGTLASTLRRVGRAPGALLAVFVALVFVPLAEAADFRCAAGDVQCVIDAINASNSNGESNTIHLQAGTYSLTQVYQGVSTGNDSLSGFPIITGRIMISGITADGTIIERANYLVDQDRRNLFRLFTVATSGQLVLEHLTLRGGNTGFQGTAGAILSYGSLTIADSVISQNYSEVVGGLQIAYGTLLLRDSRVQNNSAGLVGGIVSIGNRIGTPGTAGPVSATIERTTVADNFTQEGSFITIASVATARITDTAVVRNQHGNGLGGAVNADGVMLVSNTTIANNRQGLPGSAVIQAGPGSLIADSTIANAQDNIAGGVRLRNSILVGVNAYLRCDGFTSLGHNLIANPEGCTGLLPSDLTGDPGLGTFLEGGRPGGGHIPLLASSRAIDAGDPAACPETDQRLLARPIDGNGDGVRGCDIGAVEFYPNVNNLLQLAAVNAAYQRPPVNADDVNRWAAGGEFRIDGTFTNLGPTNICHVAFEISTLSAATAAVTLMAPDGNSLGQAGVTVPATALGASADLIVQGQETYRFRIGVSRPEAITFFVNVLGEPFAGSCAF